MGRVDGQLGWGRRNARDARVAGAVVAWFGAEGRELPWRGRRTGYTGLVSEAMLQQTQVPRVVERYRAFMKRFPTVRALAAASEQEVLNEWRGLGYYRRARLLHAAARMVVGEFGARVPRDVESLMRLPGVGRYSAGSIASIVYGRAAPIVDGNVLRVLARLEARPGRAGDPSLVRWAWTRAGTLVSAAEDPGRFNEGLMELGAVVCTPRAPRCDACPLRAMCVARRRGSQEVIPGARQRVARRRVHWHAVVVSRGPRVLLERRPADGMWSRMWQVPTVEAGRALPARRVGEKVGLAGVRKLGSFEHGTTHRLITFHVYKKHLGHATRGPRHTEKVFVWRRLDELDDLPMSNAQRKVLALADTYAGG